MKARELIHQLEMLIAEAEGDPEVVVDGSISFDVGIGSCFGHDGPIIAIDTFELDDDPLCTCGSYTNPYCPIHGSE